MDDKQVINTILTKEGEISNKFHQAVFNILRLGYNTKRGHDEVSNLIGSVQYSLDELERIIKINDDHKEE